ncbi:distal membrane-arm assembly complex protein 2 [Bombina bombina]|uniref:distal membrane-arm assembly complex protein 2 n=1 Tax=Bombina bombina TaxID=8345 RepID=UPI00235AA3F9|nr:distal membrane-arm assembly complex protein 2 [Bombina bombina]
MAAPRSFQQLQCLKVPFSLCWGISRLSLRSFSSISSPPDSSSKNGFMQFLYNQFYDIEAMLNWRMNLKYWNLRRKNVQYTYTQNLYGHYVAAAFYTLSQRGSVRFQGQESWYRPNSRGRFSWDFLQHKDVPLECVDLSGSRIAYQGLDNIVSLKELQELNLRACPHLDDWALSRLQVFKDSLEVLSLAGCPQVTERGLATLHHLQKLKHLDVSNLPSVSNKGLVRILLEEVLPGCEIVGMDYTDGLDPTQSSASHIFDVETKLDTIKGA